MEEAMKPEKLSLFVLFVVILFVLIQRRKKKMTR